MKLDLLQTFLAIVDTGSLSRAAERLHLTQSTVTARLQALEDNVGQQLINRQKSGVTLTAAGLRLQRYAEAMQDLWKQARHELSLPVSMGMSINLGVNSTLWTIGGLNAISLLSDKFENVPIMIRSGKSSELRQWMKTGVINAMLDLLPDHAGEEVLHSLPPERLILVSTRQGSPVIHDPNYIFIEYSAEFSRQHAAVFASADTARIGFDNPVLGLDYMRRKRGSAYMPEHLVADMIADGHLFEVNDAPEFKLPRYLIASADINPQIEWLINVVDKANLDMDDIAD